jgi:1-acyl-sn-glycerol-3-phosphate acyltransferase
MFGAIKAYYKLVSVLWMTFTATTALVIKQKLRPKDKRKLSNEYRKSWAERAVKILGIEIGIEGKIPDERVIFVSNHRSYVDPPIIMASTGCTMLSKAEVKKMPIIGAGAEAVDILFVEREKRSSRVESMEVIADALERGVSVGIFPEGTTNYQPQLLPFKPGIFNIASKRNCAVVPIALSYSDPSNVWGEESMYTYYMRCFSKGKIEVKLKFGPVWHCADPRELRQRAYDWIQQNLDEQTFERDRLKLRKDDKEKSQVLR